MRPLIITGCARSGTLYIAEVLRALGFDAGHERLYSPTRAGPVAPQTVEVSWLAAPHRIDGALVVHQVRHPLKVVASLLARGTFRESGRRVRYGQYAARWCPRIRHEADELNRCLRYWLDWNALVRADVFWHVEAIRPDMLEAVLHGTGREPQRPAAEALSCVPCDTHHAPGRRELTWEDLTDRPLAKDARRRAQEYGYA